MSAIVKGAYVSRRQGFVPYIQYTLDIRLEPDARQERINLRRGRGVVLCSVFRAATSLPVWTHCYNFQRPLRLLAENLQLHDSSEGEQRIDTLHRFFLARMFTGKGKHGQTLFVFFPSSCGCGQLF